MKSRKFPTFNEAINYLEAAGKLKYGGREGVDAKTYVYSLEVGPRIYVVLVEEDGNVKVIHERYL